MSDEQQHDEPVLPADAVEDLSPADAEQDVKGGALNAYLKIEQPGGDSLTSGLKYDVNGEG